MHVELGKGTQTLRAMIADDELSEKMDVKKGFALLFIERDSYSFNKELIEHMELYYKYDQYAFTIDFDLSVD